VVATFQVQNDQSKCLGQARSLSPLFSLAKV
jgi:hypothetical protein